MWLYKASITCCPKGSIKEVSKKNKKQKKLCITSQSMKATKQQVCPQQIMDDTYIYTCLTKTALWDMLSKQHILRASDVEQPSPCWEILESNSADASDDLKMK